MLSERILKLPGFLYQIGNNYYYLGKWICKECTDQAATDCVTMYQMCRAGKEEPETNTYFQKLRAYSDFALEVPYNPSKIAPKVNKLEQAKKMLRELAETSTSVQSSEIFDMAEDLNISKRTLENAKKELGIKARRIGNSWYWDLDKVKPE